MKYDYAGLIRETLPSGAVRWRVLKDGDRNRKTRLPMGPGEPGFDAHYWAAREGKPVETVKPKSPVKGTLDELCDNYLRWFEEWVSGGHGSPLTLSGRRRGLRQACDTRDVYEDRLGALNADLPEEAFQAIWDSFGARTGAAETCFKALKAAYKWGEKRGYPKGSAIHTMKSEHKGKGGAVAWTDTDVARFLERHGPGTMARLWFCLADCTAGRIGDAPSLGPSNEVNLNGERALSWQPKKAGSKSVTVPMTDMLRAELREHDDMDRATYLVTDYGKPFASSGSLDNRVRKWIIEAGLTNSEGKAIRSQHGIRKGVAQLLANRGATEYEIMAVLSHADPRTTRIYTEKAEREGLALSASIKRKGRN
jgi:integrase